jgi:hypothetical protein
MRHCLSEACIKIENKVDSRIIVTRRCQSRHDVQESTKLKAFLQRQTYMFALTVSDLRTKHSISLFLSP